MPSLITTETRAVTLSRYVTLKLDLESQSWKFWAVAETLFTILNRTPLALLTNMNQVYELAQRS